MQETEQLARDLTINLLERLGFKDPQVDVKKDEQDRIKIQIDVPAEDSGLLIGFHGENIFALQTILSHMLANQLGDWQLVIINVGDYRERRRETLQNMAENIAQRAKSEGQAITLPYLNSSERRIIHMSLSDDPDINTYSEGEGRKRRLIVEPS